MSAGDVPIDGLLCPGHVSVILGWGAYRPIAEKYHMPCVVAGFEPANMLDGITRLIRQVAAGHAKVENAYGVAVTEAGNAHALRMIEKVFEPAPAVWRAMGEIPASGLALRPAYARFDARAKFGVEFGPDYEPPGCRCGEVIQGKLEPPSCGLFGEKCTPASPVGPCMVSSEGACAAWYKYSRGQRGNRSPNGVLRKDAEAQRR
jgi:hydrogenase expression/formation protein HypD